MQDPRRTAAKRRKSRYDQGHGAVQATLRYQRTQERRKLLYPKQNTEGPATDRAGGEGGGGEGLKNKRTTRRLETESIQGLNRPW